jgi:hypothetical protein
MSFPDVNSTPDDAKTEYARTVGYESDATGALALAFIRVCRWMQAQRPLQSTTSMQASAKFESIFESLQAQIDSAQKWLANLNATAANDIAAYQTRTSLPRQFGLADLRGC